MSCKVLRYVRSLTEGKNGEPIKTAEKAALWYLADAYNDEQRAAWPAVSTIARANNWSHRYAQIVLGECIRKGIIWREPRRRLDGSNRSNCWRFVRFDGEPPLRVKPEELTKGKKRIEGTNAINLDTQPKISTATCEKEGVPEHPDPEVLDSRGCCLDLADRDLAFREQVSPHHHRGDESDSPWRTASHPLNPYGSTTEPLRTREAIQIEHLVEADDASSCEKLDSKWRTVLDRLRSNRAIVPGVHRILLQNTRAIFCEENGRIALISVTVRDPAYTGFLKKLEGDLQITLTELGFCAERVHFKYQYLPFFSDAQ